MNEIDAYLDQFEPKERAELEKIRSVVRRAVPEAEECISYGMPAFKFKKKYLVGYSAYKDHLSLFPTPGPIEKLKDQLKDYKLSKGTIQFTLQNPLPESLVKDIIAMRVAEISK